MKTDKSLVIVLCFAAFIVAATGISLLFRPTPKEEEPSKDYFRCIIELDKLRDTTSALVVGYNYFLLKDFADSTGRDIDISVTPRNISYTDSLLEGKIDILVAPFLDTVRTKGLTASRDIDSLSVWLMRDEDKKYIDEINHHIEKWYENSSYEDTKNSFLRRFDAFRSRRRGAISPYDDLIKAHADFLGWDWRMLAAIIYQESRFHIEATSHKGAKGLMQMMPKTAKRYGLQDPLDPEASIEAGAKLLCFLMRRYNGVGENREEQFKLALAAYNAGVGRADDILNLARTMGVETGRWDNLVEYVIPKMRDTDSLDTTAVRLGIFKGFETIKYVRRVDSIYNEFCRICPE